MMRKLEVKKRYFTSQIDVLPGPKNSIIKNLASEYKEERKEQSKFADEKYLLKNRVFYGSHYQDQKYVDKVQPTTAYKTYKKDVKNEWNRNPNNEHTKKARDMLFYKTNKIY